MELNLYRCTRNRESAIKSPLPVIMSADPDATLGSPEADSPLDSAILSVLMQVIPDDITFKDLIRRHLAACRTATPWEAAERIGSL